MFGQRLRGLSQANMASMSISSVSNCRSNSLGNLIEGCKTAGPHYNPEGALHGGPDSEVRHHGDMGNITAGDDGVAHVDYEDRLLQLTGPHSIIGRACVCHADTDDLGLGGNEASTQNGNAGARVACGVIGISGPF